MPQAPQKTAEVLNGTRWGCETLIFIPMYNYLIIISQTVDSAYNHLIIYYNLCEVPNAKIWPECLNELVLTLVCLMQEEVTQSDFIRCADKYIWAAVSPTVEVRIKLFNRSLLRFLGSHLFSCSLKGINYFVFGVVA